MSAGYYELEWVRGNTFKPVLDMLTGFEAYPLTGSTLIFRVIDSSDTEYLRISSATADSGIEITDAANGEVTFSISKTVTRNAPTTPLTYALEWRFDDEQVTLMYGPLKIRKDANDDV
jgi:hypothetical protein